MIYIYSLSDNPFELSSFDGDNETAISNGYKEITDEQYEKLKKHQLCWKNSELVENNDNSRDDGTEIGIILGSYEKPRTKRIVDGFCSKGAKVVAVLPEELRGRDYSNVKFVINADKDAYNYIVGQNPAIKFYNTWKASYSCNDKWLTYQLLKMEEIPQPITSLKSEDIQYPKVIKTRIGSFGSGVFLANDLIEETEIISGYNQKDLLYQQYIESSKGKDVCAYVVGDEIVAAMKRENKSGTEFRSHTIFGAVASAYEMADEQKDLCAKISKTLGLDFCSLNFLVDDDGSWKVCDVNASPGIDVIEAATRINVVDKYVDYVISKVIN